MRAVSDVPRLLIVAAYALCLLSEVCCSKVNRTPHCYVFPRGFLGWASISYGIDSAELPKFKQGCIVFDFSASANIKTSFSAPVGWASDQFEEVDGGGSYTRLPSAAEASVRALRKNYFETEDGKTTEWIFVGTLADLESAPDPDSMSRNGGVQQRRNGSKPQ